jgi:hypothetical protein
LIDDTPSRAEECDVEESENLCLDFCKQKCLPRRLPGIVHFYRWRPRLDHSTFGFRRRFFGFSADENVW